MTDLAGENRQTEWVDGVDPSPEMFENTPWAEPSNREILEAVQRLETKFDELIELVSTAVAQIRPTIEALRENPLKFLTGKLGK